MIEDDIFWVVSNFKQDPSQVIEVIDSGTSNYLVCDQGGGHSIPDWIRSSENYTETKHSGHNISDYLNYIIKNYDSLPSRIGLIKGNLFPRHIQKEIFLKRKLENGFVPLYSDPNTFKPAFHRLMKWKLVAQQIAPGFYIEINNNWYKKTRSAGKRFPKLENFLEHFFKVTPPKYVTFVPGACMIVPREKILRWPKELYEEMYESVTYDFFPVEAFHAERSMLYLFHYATN